MPFARRGHNWLGRGLAATLVDSLSTMYVMGLKEEFLEARQWVEQEMSKKFAEVLEEKREKRIKRRAEKGQKEGRFTGKVRKREIREKKDKQREKKDKQKRTKRERHTLSERRWRETDTATSFSLFSLGRSSLFLRVYHSHSRWPSLCV
jgi:hypothetical protein